MSRPTLASWLVVAACFVALSVSFSARSALGLVMPHIQDELGWSRSFVSSGGAFVQILMAIVAPIAGAWVGRYGPRLMLSAGLAAVGIGVLLTAFATAQWQFIIAYGVIAGIGFGVAATHLASTIVSLEFDERRGLAVGIATAGSTAGQLVVIPLLAVVLETASWRWSYGALGLACLVLVPVIVILIRPRAPLAAGETRRYGHAEPFFASSLALLRVPVFHLLFWSYFICGVTTSGVIETHLIPYTVACGYPPLEGATAYGVLSAFNLGGMVLAGWLTDRMNRPLLLGTIYVMRALSFIVLMFIADNQPLLYLFVVMFGLFDYSTVPVTASLAASHLGLRLLGLTMGLLTAGHALGAALGAYMGGYLFDLFGRYQSAWTVSVVVALMAGLLSFAIRETRRPSPGVAPATA